MTIPLTVALLTYNRPHYLQLALRAIIEQTYTDFELLVMDNGSTDNTPEVVLGFKDDRLRYVRNAPGHPASFNGTSAVLIARGKRLLITHDDDIMEADMLQRQMAMFDRNPELAAIWTNQSTMDENGQRLLDHLAPPGPDRIYARGEYIAKAAEERHWHPPSSLIFTPGLLPLASLHKVYRGLPLGTGKRAPTEGSGDYIIPAQMNLKAPVAFLNAPLLRYRQHGGQETNHADLTGAVLHGYVSLRRFVVRTDYKQQYVPVYDALIARYKAQRRVTEIAGSTLPMPALRQLQRMFRQGSADLAANPRAGFQLLPLALLLHQHAAAGTESELEQLLRIMPAAEPALQTSIHRLYRWAGIRHQGGNLFRNLAPGSRIVILGSVLLSALLVQEARQAGVHVVCCLDSSVTRQGCNWLGTTIVPPSWLAENDVPLAAIVLSSERDHEDELIHMLRRHDAETLIVSWKQLVEQYVQGSVAAVLEMTLD